MTLCRARPWCRFSRWLVAGLLALLGAGCTTLAPQPGSGAEPPGPLQQCVAWYAALDTWIERAGVRDAGGTSVAGYPHLRVDRFTASLRDHLVQAANPVRADAVRTALMGRLLALDLEARGFEITNLPDHARRALAAAGAGSEPADLMQSTRNCGALLVASDLSAAHRTDGMLAALAVPDDYVTAYRLLGLYGLTRMPFLAGVRQFEAGTQARFDQTDRALAGRERMRLSPPDRAPQPVSKARLRQMLEPPAGDALGIPSPSSEQLEALFAHFAPEFDIGVDSADDLPGLLFWSQGSSAGQGDPPRVDGRQPVVYRHTAYTRFGHRTLLQLVYTIWFGARPASTAPIDLLAGQLDGLVWRVTLSPEGEPLVYDSIHPCGCYHLFFPGPLVDAIPAPDPQVEWAFSPRRVPRLTPGERLVLHVAPGTHYLEGLEVAHADQGAAYAWRDYNSLRSLPTDTGRRSVFNLHGFIDGTDRAESWLFWPMGIARAGTMRQWGRHATAFVGRRHFDDARLLEQRFAPLTAPDD